MGYLICDNCAGYYELQDGESPKDFERCRCGGNLNYVEAIEENKTLLSNFKLSNAVIIRITGIFIGTLIMLIPYYFFSPDPSSVSFVYNQTSLLLWGAGGLAAAFIAGGKIKSGLSNGFIAAIISGLLVITFFYFMAHNYFNNPSLAENIAFFVALASVYLLVPAIFSVVGGLIGISIRRILIKLFHVA